MRLFSVYSYSYSSLIILCMALHSNTAGPTFLRSDTDFGRIRLDAILTAGRDRVLSTPSIHFLWLWVGYAIHRLMARSAMPSAAVLLVLVAS